MKLNLRSNVGKLATAGGALVAAGVARADGASTFDYSSVSTAVTTVAAITAAVFLVYVAIKVGSWARRAL